MASSIPGAVSNLYLLVSAAFSNSDAVSVEYNPIHKYKFPANTSRINILGWTGDQEPAELGPSYRREETFQIHMEIAAHTGEQSITAQMSLQTTVMDNFATISALVANNFRLPSTDGGSDGTVRFAEVGTFTYNPLLQPRGSLGVLTFAVHCSQRITSLS